MHQNRFVVSCLYCETVYYNQTSLSLSHSFFGKPAGPHGTARCSRKRLITPHNATQRPRIFKRTSESSSPRHVQYYSTTSRIRYIEITKARPSASAIEHRPSLPSHVTSRRMCRQAGPVWYPRRPQSCQFTDMQQATGGCATEAPLRRGFTGLRKDCRPLTSRQGSEAERRGEGVRDGWWMGEEWLVR